MFESYDDKFNNYKPHEYKDYLVYFMRGDKFVVRAKSEGDAIRGCIKNFPQTTSWDLLKVEEIKHDE